MRKQRNLHYSFFVAAGCFLVMFYGMGMTFNLCSLFLSAAVSERGVSQSQISDAMTLQSVVCLLCILFLGRIYAKYSPRLVLAVCSLAGGLAYVCFMRDSLFMCYLGACFVGVAHGGAALVPVSILLTNWFHKYRGTVLSCCMVGSSLPNVLWSRFISGVLNRFGLTYASAIQGAVILALCVAALLLIRDTPEEMGLRPFGFDEGAGGPENQQGENRRKTGLVSGPRDRTRRFVLLSCAMFMAGFVITPLNGFYPTFLQSIGYDTLFLGAAATIFGFTMMISKLTVGGVIDFFGIKKASVYLYVLPAAATAAALLVTPQPASAILFIALWGIGNPLGTVPLPLWVISIFGQEDYKLTYSRVLTIFTMGSTCGFFLIGKIADWTQSYHLIFVLNLLSLSASFFLVMLAQQGRKPADG